jgi:HEAT repeats
VTGRPRRADALEAAIQGADVILVGTVLRVEDAPGDPSAVAADARPDADALRSALVEVLRVVAGDPPGRTVPVLFLEGRMPSRPWIGLWPGEPLLLFLRSSAQGHVPVDPTERPIRAVARIPLAEPGASPVRAVAHELEQAILHADAADVVAEAAAARLEIRSPVDAAGLLAAAGSDPLRRAAAAAVSLAEGDLEGLGDVGGLVAGAGTPEMEVVRNLLIATVAGVRDPSARPALAALLAHPRTELARSAARALRALRDPAAAPAFLAGLDHPDQEVRYQAMMGLAELYPGSGPAPSFERFRGNEGAYLDAWRRMRPDVG